MKRTTKAFILIILVFIIALISLLVVMRKQLGNGLVDGTLLSRKSRPNIILITMDTTRRDHLSCYGYQRKTSKNLDNLAKEGVVFKSAISNSSWTYPSHASLMTGMYTISHGAYYDLKGSMGIMDHAVNRFSDSNKTLAEILRHNGYKTIGIIGGIWLKRQFGLNKGFEIYEDDVYDLEGLKAEQIHQLVHKYINRSTPSPFFLFVNYFDPHTPYSAPEPFDSMFSSQSLNEIGFSEKDINKFRKKPDQKDLEIVLGKYDGEIAYMDFYMGKLFDLLKTLGMYDNSWIIVVADHGESFGEHSYMGHGGALYENLIHVPLIMKYPKGWRSDDNIEDRLQLMDIMPTILDRLKIPIPRTCQGQPIGNVSHKIIAELHRNRGDILSFGKRFDRDLRTIYEGPYKFIGSSDGKNELYDIVADPQENHNIVDDSLSLTGKFTKQLDEWYGEVPRAEKSSVEKMDKRTVEQLKALGYLN